MTDQGWSNWWCERQRYSVVAVAAAAAIRGWRNQTESMHRRVAMSCWPRRRGKSCSGKDRRRNQEKCQGLLTVVGRRGERILLRRERTAHRPRARPRCGDVLIFYFLLKIMAVVAQWVDTLFSEWRSEVRFTTGLC